MRCNFTAESMRTQHLDLKKTEASWAQVILWL